MAKGRVFFGVMYATLAVVVLLAGLIFVVGSAFIGLKPAPDRAELPGGAVLVKDGFSNVFILPTGPETVALIDCGMDPEAKAVTAVLKAQGLTRDAVEAVFITHGHGDHTGGCKAFPRARIHALQAEVGMVEGTATAKSPMTGFTAPKPKPTGLKVAQALSDGQVVEMGVLRIKALAVPGHTPGSAAYAAGGVLFLGDAASVTDDDKLKNSAWVFSTDSKQASRSLKALAGRIGAETPAVQTIAPAHSAPAPVAVLMAY
jgi:glyoxylase-like metal-dependent hydrolase (beta-lactamase superfamily II)